MKTFMNPILQDATNIGTVTVEVVGRNSPLPATDSSQDLFVVALWDETNSEKFVSVPDNFWSTSRKTGFPNAALFWLGAELRFDQWGRRWKGFDDQAVFVVPTTPWIMRTEADWPYPVLQKPCCHFLTVSLRGKVPKPNSIPPQIIEGGFEGVIKTIESMWPTARHLIATSLPQPPKGWEILRRS